MMEVEEANTGAKETGNRWEECRDLKRRIEIEQDKDSDRNHKVDGPIDPGTAKVAKVGALQIDS